VYVGLVPVVEELLRWAGMYVPFIAPHFFLWFVVIFPAIHMLLHIPLVDRKILKEQGRAAFGRRLLARYALSASFGFASWGASQIYGFDPRTFGAIRPSLAAHVLNNAFYEQLHTLVMSVSGRTSRPSRPEAGSARQYALAA
jgi:hypothetical protein